MTIVLLAAQLLLSSVFLIAGLAKALRPGEFLSTLESGGVPPRLIVPLGRTIPLVEIPLAVSLATVPDAARQITLAAAAVLLACFTGWLAWVRIRHRHLRCGCFGAEGREIVLHNEERCARWTTSRLKRGRSRNRNR